MIHVTLGRSRNAVFLLRAVKSASVCQLKQKEVIPKITTKEGHRAALARVNELWGRVQMGTPDGDLFDSLITPIVEYEKEQEIDVDDTDLGASNEP